MHKSENQHLTSFNLKTYEVDTIDMFKEEIEESDRVLVFSENDGVEFKVLTVTAEQHEKYAIIRINCN